MNNGIGHAIRYYRERAGMSQRDFAKALGYKNHTSITKIENGMQDISLSVVEQIAKLFNVSPVTFFYFDNEEFSEYIPYLADASEETLRTIRYMLHMPEKKSASASMQGRA